VSAEHPKPSTTGGLDDATVLAALEAERLTLCTRLDGLDPPAWQTPSLCPGWTVRDVVAHLTLSTRESTWDFVRGMLRYRGNFDRMAAERARDRASTCTPGELVVQIRETAGSPSVSFGSSLRDGLIDVVVHTQDIARPLGRTWPAQPESLVIALDHAMASRWYGARKRLAHAELTATDLDWSGGTGVSSITGPSVDLLLVATGRPEGLERLDGPGVAELRTTFGA
jgi:uncharacterized protein (TIGR03083 family)